MSPVSNNDFSSLLDRYRLNGGSVPLSGIQGIIRAMIDSSRADRDQGERISTFISGYEGSPLGGLDIELNRAIKIASEHRIIFQPALNEELAATSISGTQQLGSFLNRTVDGVTGIWYGKSPGVDRATDAIRHGNLIGTSPKGGAVVLAGDDPAAKSSTVPGSSEATLAALSMPVLFPGNTQELLSLFRHGVLMSRVSGLWCGFKVATKVADSTGVFTIDPFPDAIVPVIEWQGKPYQHRPNAKLLGPKVLEMEETLYGVRLELAREYIFLNKLNPTTGSNTATLGIIAAGTAYFDLLTALEDLRLANSPAIRIMKMTAVHPIDKRQIREFSTGLREILIIEEKGSFVERAVKDVMYETTNAPRISGKTDPNGLPLVPSCGAFEADDIARVIARRAAAHFDSTEVLNRMEELADIDNRTTSITVQRTPFFCSGCPHNSSTRADQDAVVGAGIGCHTMVLLSPAGRGDVVGLTQMGGEGAQFIGIAPFVKTPHFFQNLGDGTFHHSGSLAIRAAVAAGINITYKILYNDAVAMTGGQKPQGRLSIPQMVEVLHSEGVKRVVITTDDPAKYRSLRLPPQTMVDTRDRLDELQRELAKIEGTTVIIHDQLCAIEKRRRRRSGKLETPGTIVVINERTCEGCGDCGVKSNCLSVEPVTTEFGRKTRINQGSCSHDRSCLKGDCPSFLLVDKTGPKNEKVPAISSVDLPEPPVRPGKDDTRIRLIGIGGTGVVTLAAVLQVAAFIDGKFTSGLDQTGLSQKGGPVISDIRITSQKVEGAVTFSSGTADLLLGFDLVGTALLKHLRVASPSRTHAVLSTSMIPTGAEVTDVSQTHMNVAEAVNLISAYTRENENFLIRSQELAMALYDDELFANAILLGSAWQLGLIPISFESLAKAFTLNNVSVETNLGAFRWGRIAVTNPEEIERILEPEVTASPISPAIAALIEKLKLKNETDRNAVALRAQDLVSYQNSALAQSYIERVQRVAELARKMNPDSDTTIVEFAKGLYKLLAYKDEYEVARLHLNWLASSPAGVRASMLLHPPILRAMGMKNKIALRRTAKPAMKMLYALRGLRASAANPFGHTDLRKAERALPDEYEVAVIGALAKSDGSSMDIIKTICALPDMIRGYESIKQKNISNYREQLDLLMKELDSLHL